jgi:hypothetical protein
MATGLLFLFGQVPNLLEPVCAGVTGSELRAVEGWGLLAAAWGAPCPSCPVCAPLSLQLIPLQTPLKTLLQIGVMPMLNGKT